MFASKENVMCRGVPVRLGWCRAEGLGQELLLTGIRTASGSCLQRWKTVFRIL